MTLASEEYDRVLVQLRSLSAEDWSRPTDCPAWDIRALASHLLGMAEMSASLREQIRQMRKAGRAGGVFIDALTGLQVDERRDTSPAQIVSRFAEVTPRAARGRRRTPGLLCRRTMPDAQPVGGKPDSPSEKWTFGFLIDVILTRDPWLHRTNIAAATGRPMHLTADHDGLLVADVVAEWAERHGRPCSLTLTGPAGGSWSFGSGGPVLQLDAVEFCRALSGRGAADGLLAVEVPF
ncbi:MAG: maleylpyruvate isomerase family mycothiol-dependent enzyme [Actinobacteria bacterium]|nr:maleylpyruvate isomerase family mycothiol-dependent enzyme [Actinomycetota bacterium]